MDTTYTTETDSKIIAIGAAAAREAIEACGIDCVTRLTDVGPELYREALDVARLDPGYSDAAEFGYGPEGMAISRLLAEGWDAAIDAEAGR